MTFIDKLSATVRAQRSVLCVGLDPSPARLTTSVEDHCRRVIDATLPYAVAYKPNLAFFEALGADGWAILERVIAHIPSDRIIIADAKRGDIGTTAEQYARAFFDELKVDAITLNPLMGFETLTPFLNDPTKAAFVLTLTSNPGAADFFLQPFAGESTLAEHIAARLGAMDTAGHVGMVIGATHPEMIAGVVARHPHGTLLIPGVGTQGGSIAELRVALAAHQGIPLVNVTRDIFYATDPAGRAKHYHDDLLAISERHSG
jgi:orotidine-5'-phosphate decarboxylase